MNIQLDHRAIRHKILTNVKHKTSLCEIKDEIAKLLCQPFLPSNLENYVEFKYFKYCLEQIENDISSHTIILKMSRSQLQSFTNQVYFARKLEDLPEDIHQIPHYKHILKERQLLSETDQLSILHKIQVAVANTVIGLTSTTTSKHSSIETYLQLLKQLYLQLKHVILMQAQENIIGYSQFAPEAIWSNYQATFKKFPTEKYEAIYVELEDEVKLFWESEFANEAALLWEHLKTAKSKLKENLFQPAKVKAEFKQGKHILTLRGPVILLSSHVKKIEQYLDSKQDIEEIHLVASEIIYVDRCLDKEKWHGKNVLAISKMVEVVIPETTWDLSGKSGKGFDETRAEDGSDENIDGKDGENGESGESGGYCTFIADSFVNMDRLTVKMDGGAGGNGKSGGHGKNGRDGADGAQMTLAKLLSDLKSPVNFGMTIDIKRRAKTYNNLNAIIQKDQFTWTDGINLYTGWSRESLFSNTSSFYVCGRTADGMKIEFGYSYSFTLPIYETEHAYCLVTGAPGEPGTPGGFGGRPGVGGKGGYGGSLATFKLNGNSYLACEVKGEPGRIGEDGKNGKDGNNGGNGRSGKNGGDVGYVDNEWWGMQTFGPDGTFKLEDNSDAKMFGASSAWCGYKKKYRSIKTTTRDPPQPVQNNRQRKNNHVVEKVAATRKNMVDHQEAINEYSEQMLQHVSLGVDKTNLQETLQALLTRSSEFVHSDKKIGPREIQITTCQPAPQKKNGKRNWQSLLRGCITGIMSSVSQSVTSPAADSNQEEDEMHDSLSLVEKRFQALEKIRAKVEKVWKHEEKTKIEYVKRQTSGKGSASALHAVFGKLNKLDFYEAPSSKRKEICQELKSKIPEMLLEDDMVIYENLRESLYAYFQDESIPSSTDSKGDEHIKVLEKYRDTFRNDPGDFNWDAMLKDKNAVEDYINFLGRPKVPFLISDLRLVAHVYNISVEIYMSYDGSSMLEPLRQRVKNAIPEMDSDTLHIAVNEYHEFSRLDSIVKPDMSGKYQQMESIVKEMFGLEDAEKIDEYLKMEKFGAKQDKERLEMFSNEDKMQIIQNISETFRGDAINGIGIFKEYKLVIETALLMWPEILLHVFHERIHSFNGIDDNFHSMFSKVVEALLNSGDEHSEHVIPFLWIIATYPPDNWTLELCLLTSQQYFHTAKNADLLVWRKIMSSFPTKLVECIWKLVESGDHSEFDKENKKEFVQFLRSVKEFEVHPGMDFSKLEEVNRCHWPFQLRKLFLASRLERLPNVFWGNVNNKQTQALYYLHALFNEKPGEVKSLLDSLQKILQNQQGKTSEITKILQNFYGGLWSLNQQSIKSLEKSTDVESWMELMKNRTVQNIGKSRSFKEIQQIVNNDSNSTLSKEELKKIFNFVARLDQFKMPAKLRSNFDQVMTDWLEDFHERKEAKSSRNGTLELELEAVAYINFVIQIKLGYFLRPTQKLAIVSALYLGSHKDPNLISQIATGEGKTCIVIAVAICRGLLGEKTDVVTSSGVLAQRDATMYKDIYSAFDLTVGEVTSENAGDRRKAYLCNVVYGEASHFERDYLLDHFYNKNIRGSRPLGNVVVDEVDSMFLDKGNSVLYLSHQPPDLDSLEGLFVFIWVNVVQMVNEGEYQPMKIQELVLSALYPTITVDDLILFLSEKQANNLWGWLVEKKVVSQNGRLLIKTVSDFPRKLPDNFTQLEKHLVYLIQSRLEIRSGQLSVMNYLKPFVEQHLMTWINSAFQATQLTERVEYMVDVDHSKTLLDKNPRIMILDLDTGVDLKGSQWNECLHQFLQLKHGCRLSPMNLKAFVGTQSDRQFLEKAYKVQVLCVPLAQPKQFVEQEPIICKDVADWKLKVFQDTEEKMKSGRSVLIICGTVQEAGDIFEHFKSSGSNNVELYKRDYEEFKATKEGETLAPGQVLISTNLAGRGTDIKLSEPLRKSGGLHVILSYLPDNLRVEQQAFGRAARCGEPGSGRLLFVDKVTSGKGDGDAIDMKIQRDDLEISRVSDIQNYYKMVIQKEEKMFELFQQSFEELTGNLEKAYKYVKDHPDRQNSEEDKRNSTLLSGYIDEMKDLVMYSMLDDWAYWLDKYSTILLNKHNEEHSTLFDKGLHKFDLDEKRNMQNFMQMTGRYEVVKEKYKDPSFLLNGWQWGKKKVGMRGSAGGLEDYALTLIHEPALLVKVAKVKIRRGEVEKAEKYLDEVVRKEPENCKVAKYYKLFCKLKTGAWKHSSGDFESLKDEVMEALYDWRDRECSRASIVTQIQNVGNRQILHGDGYKQQKEGIIWLIGVYIQSVENMMPNERLVAADFGRFSGGDNKVAEHLIQYLVDQEAVLETAFADKMDPGKVRKLAVGFAFGERWMSGIMGGFKGRQLTRNVEKELKDKLDLPSRSGFWKEIKSCFEEIECFSVVQPQALFQENSANRGTDNKPACERNDFTKWEKARKGKFMITKYGADMSTNMLRVVKGDKIKFQGEQEYRSLRKTGRLCYEEVATLNIDKLKKLELSKYCRIGIHDFTMIQGISQAESASIFGILVKSNVVAEDGVLLTTEWRKENLDLTKMGELYRGDILSILQSKCRYKYELLSLLHQVESSSNESTNSINDISHSPMELTMSLPSRPTKNFIMTCVNLGLVKGNRANPEYFKQTLLENIFREPLSWATFAAKKTGLLAMEKSTLVLEDLHNLFPEENCQKLKELLEELRNKSWMNSQGEIILDPIKDTNFHLRPPYEHYEPDIFSFVKWQQEKVKEDFFQYPLSIVFEAMGQLNTVENPDPNLVDIEIHVDITSGESSSPSNRLASQLVEQIQLLALSGFDHVIAIREMVYSRKMIFSAIAVIIIGLGQIAMGVWLEFQTLGAGTLIAAGVISEGINDVFQGIMAFSSGRFSWQDWTDNKWRSVALTTIATILGGCVAYGVQYSKYGQQLFGSSGILMSERVIQETLKEGGKAGITRSVSPLLQKTFGKHVLQGCTRASRSIAVSFAYENAVKQVVNWVSAKIIEFTQTGIDNHAIVQTFSNLCDLYGLDECQEILKRCFNRLKRDSSFVRFAAVYFNKILNPIMNGLGNGIRKMNQAGTHVNPYIHSLMNVMNLGSEIKNKGMTLYNIKNIIIDYINKLEREIRREMELENRLNPTEQGNVCTEEERHEFIFQAKRRTKELMQQKIGAVMQSDFIKPLMNSMCNKLRSSLEGFTREKYIHYKEGKLMDKVQKLKFEWEQNPEATEEVKRDLQRQVLRISAQSRNPNLVAYVAQCGGPLGVESVQCLADMLGVKIVVDSNNANLSKVYEPHKGKGVDGERKTLRLKHTMCSDDPNDLGSWVATGDGGQADVVDGGSSDCLLEAVNNELKRENLLGGDRVEINRNHLADFMRIDANFRNFVVNGYHHTYHSIGGFGGPKTYRCEQLEITDSTTKKKAIEKMNRIQKRLRASKLQARKNVTHPINEHGTEEIEDKTVVNFLAGEITSKSITHTKSGSLTTNERSNVMGDGRTMILGTTPSLMANINSFPQNKSVTLKVIRDVNKMATEWVQRQDTPGKDKTVEYMILHDNLAGSTEKQAEAELHYHQFKLDGKVVSKKVHKVINPAYNCPPPPRGESWRRNIGEEL